MKWQVAALLTLAVAIGSAQTGSHPAKRQVKKRIAIRATAVSSKAKSKTAKFLELSPDFALRRLAYPFKTIPADAFEKAAAQRDRMDAGRFGVSNSAAKRIGASSMWKNIGPFNWNPLIYGANAWSGTGAVTGRVNAVAYDPKTPTTLYAGGASGGVFKSTDAGRTWTSLSDNWKFLNISSIAIDPTNSKTLYVGTGDFKGGQGFSYRGGTIGHSFGLMKSTDGGATWKNLGVGQFDKFAVSRVLIDPDNVQIITVTAGDMRNQDSVVSQPPETGGIWRSTDGGTTWKQATGKFFYQESIYNLSARWCDVVVTPKGTNGKRRYYAIGTGPTITGDSAAAPILLFASDDQGVTWQQINGPWKPANQTAAVAVSPTTLGTLYVLSNGDQTVFQSTDAGKTWKNINYNLNNLVNTAPDDNQWDQVDYNFFLACSTATVNGKAQDVVYMGQKGIYQLPDGKTWNDFGTIWSDGGSNAKLHTDQHCVAFNPANPNQGLFGNDGGVYAFSYSPTTKTSTFNALNANLNLCQFYGAAFHPTNPAILLGGAQDNSTGFAAGDTNVWGSIIGGDGGHTIIDKNNPLRQYGTYINFKSLNYTNNGWKSEAGNLFDSLDKNKAGKSNFTVPIALNPTDSNLVYTAGTVVCIYDWTSKSWTYSNKVTTGSVLCLAFSSDGGTVYTGADDGQIWKSTDFGVTFKRIDNVTLPNRVVNSIVVSPTNPNSILVGLSGFGQNGARLDHVWVCNNTAATKPVYASVSTATSGFPDIPVNTIALDPILPASIYYVGTDIGVFMTSNNGKSWQNATYPLGLPNVGVSELHAMPGQGNLYAVTYGRGIYRVNLMNGEPIYSLTLVPSTTKGGTTTTATLLLGSPAPVGGATFKLSSSDTTLATVPATVAVKAGATSVTFPVRTLKVDNSFIVNITAATTKGTLVSRSTQLIVNP